MADTNEPCLHCGEKGYHAPTCDLIKPYCQTCGMRDGQHWKDCPEAKR